MSLRSSLRHDLDEVSLSRSQESAAHAYPETLESKVIVYLNIHLSIIFPNVPVGVVFCNLIVLGVGNC